MKSIRFSDYQFTEYTKNGKFNSKCKQYKQAMHLIEAYLQKANKDRGFDRLNEKEADELPKISLLAAGVKF